MSPPLPPLAFVCAVLFVASLEVPSRAQSPPASAAPAAAVSLLDSGVGEACTVRGRLLGRSGKPVVAAAVWFVPDQATLAAFGVYFGIDEVQQIRDDLRARLPHVSSDEDGRFELPGRVVAVRDPNVLWSPPDPLILIDHPAHALRGVRVTGLVHGATVDLGTWVLSPAATVRGRAVDELGRPLSGVGILLDENFTEYVPDHLTPCRGDWDASEVWRHEKTDAEGRFEIRQLWSHVLEVSFWPEQRLPRRVEGVRPPEGGSLDLGDVRLDPGLSIEGNARGEDGRPIVGARVLVTRPIDWEGINTANGLDGEIADAEEDAQNVYGAATTDAAGHFRVGGLESANCWVYVSADGCATGRVIDIAPGGAALAFTLKAADHPAPAAAPTGEPPQPLVRSLRAPDSRAPVAVLEGTLTWADGAPVIGHEVMAQGARDAVAREWDRFAATTDIDGRFRFFSLGWGDWTLTDDSLRLGERRVALGSLSIPAPGGAKPATLALVLPPRARLDGHLDLAPADISTASVVVWPAEASDDPEWDYDNVSVGLDGAWRVELPEGSWRIAPVVAGQRLRLGVTQVVTVSKDGVCATATPLALTVGGRLFSARFVDETTGRPISGIAVSVRAASWVGASQHTLRTVDADSDGVVHFEAGDDTCEIQATRHDTLVANIRLEAAPSSGAGDDSVPEIRLPPITCVHGHVMFPDGVPARPWFAISLQSNHDGPNYTAVVGKDGSFRFDGVAPGDFVLAVPTALPGSTRDAPAQTTIEREVKVVAGADVVVDFLVQRPEAPH